MARVRRTQEERSATMRVRLLDATVACLAERGYARTTTTEVARRARVSRGAQLHHFPTKQALVTTAVEHLFRRRHDEFRAAFARAPARVDRASAAIDLLWAMISGPSFHAWLELVVAARTEPDLLSLLAAVDKRFAERAELLCQKFLMPHIEDKEEIAATARLILAMFDGLATHRILSRDDAAAKRALKVAARAGLFTRRSSSGGDA